MPVGDPKSTSIAIDRFLILRKGDVAPTFAAKTLAGEDFKLSDYRGKVVLLDFWATWCAPCIASMPGLQHLSEEFGKDGRFVIVGVSVDEKESTARTWLKNGKAPWLHVGGGLVDENPVAKLYNVVGVPETFLIDQEGKIVGAGLSEKQLREEIARLLSVKEGDKDDTAEGVN